MEVPETPIRVGQKQTRAVEGNRGVRVIDSVGRLVGVIREPSVITKYLAAPNAEAVRDHKGSVRAIRLASLSDDRGEMGERHGSSLVTTERCKNAQGKYIGTPLALKHKLDRSEGC